MKMLVVDCVGCGAPHSICFSHAQTQHMRLFLSFIMVWAEWVPNNNNNCNMKYVLINVIYMSILPALGLTNEMA